MKIPESHPRYQSLMTREKIVEGIKAGIVAPEGLIAHGRGEAFDYIMGERSNDFALKAERAAVALMLTSKHPVISVNGNAAILAAKELAELGRLIDAPLEVNIFHFRPERVEKIKNHLLQYTDNVLAACDAELEGLESARRIVDSRGIYVADAVLVPLEDGDRCEILKKHGKKVISIDLNPLSRTSLMADISIVDNLTRAIPNMIEFAKEMKGMDATELHRIVESYDNRAVLSEAIKEICRYLSGKAEEVL